MSFNDVPIHYLKKCPIGLLLSPKVELKRPKATIAESCVDCAFRDGANCKTAMALRAVGEGST